MSYSKLLLVSAAVFGLVGTVMGGHMAGAGSPALRPIHAHILVAGWLSLFAWSIFYKVYQPPRSIMTAVQVWTGLIGTIGLCAGMYFFFLEPFPTPELFNLLFYIISGTVLIVSYLLFVIITIKTPSEDHVG
ncbi:hypothetical protein [Alkalicoccus chagannorensis]|uniref:hypothetical protein n=1 Tax=Alkalicoccus chagannorensis TaxID=427072 RepID=UPI0004175D14|nr:hypothetical protein [Alkalicoccus chagannorensis]